jgi:hypothetical protein
MRASRRLLLGTAAAAFATRARAAEPVDAVLVLAADASGSIDAEEYRLQKEGIAAAIQDGRVLAGIRSGALGRIAVAYVEWGAPGGAATMVPPMLVSSPAEAAAFARALMAAPRSLQSWNAIGDAIDHCAAVIATAPFEPTRKVIDISGDAGDMRSLRPAPIARDAAVGNGIVINALAIVEGRTGLVATYERDVIGGPGAFVEAAATRADFTAALRRKLIREIA